MQSAISFGATLLGAVFGRKLASSATIGRATTAARSVGRVARERADVGRAEESLEALRGQLAALEAQFASETEHVGAVADPATIALEEVRIRPRKADTTVSRLALAWVPEPAGTA